MDNALRHSFAIPEVAELTESPEGLARLDIRTDLSSGQIHLQGAHVTAFQPAGQAPVLFMSERSHFAPGQPIRGGVPLCFPWFGPRFEQPDSPSHGFARTAMWEIESLRGSASKGVDVWFRLESSDATRALWPHQFIARYRVQMAATLTLTLEVQNTSATPFIFEEALHTYLAVSDAREISITGLEGITFLDKTDALRRKLQGPDPIRISGELDRVYLDTPATCGLHDPGASRLLVVEKSGSVTTVVWNPWITKAAALPDFGDDEWPKMVCIETANASENALTLAPGATHRIGAVIRAEPIAG
ncbi:MAG: aldose 1-epimerase [Chthoniobacter sp.]|jgi:glucose-6-phosphate 1-epimerase|nr:aldose 1-epimerase [Chthoniobacter sp.]